jgi:hypothetical protein
MVVRKMSYFVAMLLASLLIGSSAYAAIDCVQIPTHVFEQYGAISWEHEKARLDNFAIQLQHDENLVGYILVFDAVVGCPSEAEARAMRAKRYLVKVRGISWNRVIWRREGHLEGLSTILQPVPRSVVLPYPLLSTVAGKDASLSKRCQSKLERIRRSQK